MQIETVERVQNMESRFDQGRPPGLYKQCNVLRHVGISTLIFSFKKVELLKFVECHPGGTVKSSNPKTQKKLPKLKQESVTHSFYKQSQRCSVFYESVPESSLFILKMLKGTSLWKWDKRV
jgi:hypothetical protein